MEERWGFKTDNAVEFVQDRWVDACKLTRRTRCGVFRGWGVGEASARESDKQGRNATKKTREKRRKFGAFRPSARASEETSGEGWFESRSTILREPLDDCWRSARVLFELSTMLLREPFDDSSRAVRRVIHAVV